MDSKKLLEELLHAEEENEVETILEKWGFLESEVSWRSVGDLVDNVAIVHAQANSANTALAEKITNAIDAVLTNACLEQGRPLRGPDAPQSFNDAVAQFFFKKPPGGQVRNYLEEATEGELRNLEKNVFLTATSGTFKRRPSITVVDKGEGQAPDNFPSTFMSLNGTSKPGQPRRSRKADIKFLQGQFGMGGSATYAFCKYQLLVSRRNPRLATESDDGSRFEEWGFTVVRKRRTDDGHFYEYLAPVDATAENTGSVLSVNANALPLLPESPPKSVPNLAYSDPLEYGTLVKLFEYPIDGTKSHITMGDSLKTRLELLMPVLALPVTAVEARDYEGKPGSFQTPIHGMHYRMQKLWESDENRFEGKPVRSQFIFQGKRVNWAAFVQRKSFDSMNDNSKKAIVFHVNGQAHATLTSSYLSRMKLETMARLNTLTLFVDCSNFSYGMVQDLFRSSRDRFTNNQTYKDFTDALIEDVRGNETLAKYQVQQRIRDREESTNSQAAAEKLLDKWLKENPLLAAFFGAGGNLDFKNPRLPEGTGLGLGEFDGREFPSKLVFKKNGKTESSQVAKPDAKARVQLVTDCTNDYFDRLRSAGQLEVIDQLDGELVEHFGYSLHNGALNLNLPTKQFSRDVVELAISIRDDSMVEPLSCNLTLELRSIEDSGSGTDGERQEPNASKGLQGNAGSVSIPDIRWMCDDKRPRKGYKTWDRSKGWGPEKALEMVIEDGTFIFFVNADHKHLIAYKNQFQSVSERLIENRFGWGLALLSLGAFDSLTKGWDEIQLEERQIEICEKIAEIVGSAASLLLPMQDMMSTLNSSDIFEVAAADEI